MIRPPGQGPINCDDATPEFWCASNSVLSQEKQDASAVWNITALFSGQSRNKVTGNQNGRYLTTVKYAISRMKDMCLIMPEYYQQRYPTEIPESRFCDHACTEIRFCTPLSNRITAPDSILSYKSPELHIHAYLPSVLPEG